MRTKMKNTAILALMLFIAKAGLTSAKAQIGGYDDGLYNYGTDGMVVNNYYMNDYGYDFYYASRINRFHRPFVSFSYYGPVFTDSYWYTYQPAYIGWNIYGNSFSPYFGWGISFNVPVYMAYYQPWYTGYYYSGYRPGIRYRNGFRNHYYWGNYYDMGYYRPYNYYYGQRHYYGYRDYVPGYGYYSSGHKPHQKDVISYNTAASNSGRYMRSEEVRNASRRNRTLYVKPGSREDDDDHDDDRGRIDNKRSGIGAGRDQAITRTATNRPVRITERSIPKAQSAVRPSESARRNTSAATRTMSTRKTATRNPVQFTPRRENETRNAVRTRNSYNRNVKPNTGRPVSKSIRSTATRTRPGSVVRTPARSKPAINRSHSRSVSRSPASAPRKSAGVRSSGGSSRKSATVKRSASRASGSKSGTSRSSRRK